MKKNRVCSPITFQILKYIFKNLAEEDPHLKYLNEKVCKHYYELQECV